jgi:hypothetical protein
MLSEMINCYYQFFKKNLAQYQAKNSKNYHLLLLNLIWKNKIMIQLLNVELDKVLQYTNLIGDLKYNLSKIVDVIWTITCTLCMLDGPNIIIDPH